MKNYCVYIIHYSGNKLPPKKNSIETPLNYIGSSTINKINNGYRGSIKSKKYKFIWNKELKENPQLFSIEIISYHDTRPEATYKELQLQKMFNMVKHPLFVNMSYAQPKGYFGMDVSKEKNPNYNKKWNTIQKQHASKIQKITHKNKGKTVFVSNDCVQKSHQICFKNIELYIAQGWYMGRKYMNTTKISITQQKLIIEHNKIKCCCLLCKEELQQQHLSRHIKSHTNGIDFFGNIYVSYTSLLKETGCTIDLYKKYYLNNIDPRPRIGSNGPPPKNYNVINKL